MTTRTFLLDPHSSLSVPESCPQTACNNYQLDFTCLHGKLYDRSKQKSKLLKAYHRLSATPPGEDKKAEFVLISGPSGTGKTSLAQTLRGPVTNDGGYFISGKFDQLQPSEPYTPLVSAFTELINLMESQGEESITQMKEAIGRAMDGDERILTDMIPALERVTGNHGEDDELRSSEFLARFRTAFRRFVRAVCCPEHPVVLFIDDMQWADPSSLDLIGSLVTDVDSRGMVIVGSCRDDVSHDSYLSCKLRELEEAKVLITNVGVRNLREEAVADMLGELLDLNHEIAGPLADIVVRETTGNAFFVMEFLRYLASKGLLYFEQDENRWKWDMKQITLTLRDSRRDDLVEMIDEKLCQMSEPVQDIMKVAACIGAKFDGYLIECACSASVDTPLEVAVNAGLLKFDSQCRTYMFVHDKIQQAAYSLILEAERASFHLHIGRKLWKTLSEAELERNIFIALNQLKHGLHMFKDGAERYGVASLCLLAGKKAIRSSGFRTAGEFLEFGIGLLGSRNWVEEYDLSLSLYNSAAEVEFVMANFERMDELIECVLLHGRSFRDKLRAYSTQVYSLGARDKRQLAVETGFDVLKRLGEPFPSKARIIYIVRDMLKAKMLLRRKSDEALMRLPLVDNPDKIAAMQMLNLVYLNAYLVRPDYLPLVLLRMVEITLHYGLCAVSSVGFAGYGALICGVSGDAEAGYRYGRLALALLDKFNSKAWVPRVYASIYGCINHWKRPLSLSLEPLRYAHKVGLETGDIEFSMLLRNLYCYYVFHCTTPLDEIERDLRANRELMEAYKQESALTMCRPYLQLILNLVGKSENPLVMTGEAFDEEKGLRDAVKKGDAYTCTALHFQKLFLAYLFGDYILAGRMAEGCRDAEKVALGSFMIVLVALFDGLAALALAQFCKEKRKNLLVARRMIKKLKKWARHAPENYLDKQCLLEAEYAAVVGKHKLAHAKFTYAIALSGEHEFKLQYALSNERAGRYWLGRDDTFMATPYLKQAYSTYVEWGAHAKATQLKKEMPSLQN